MSTPDLPARPDPGVSLRSGEHPPVLRGSYFAEVLAEMNADHHALTRSLLGVAAGDADAPEQSTDRLVALEPVTLSGRTPQRASPFILAAE